MYTKLSNLSTISREHQTIRVAGALSRAIMAALKMIMGMRRPLDIFRCLAGNSSLLRGLIKAEGCRRFPNAGPFPMALSTRKKIPRNLYQKVNAILGNQFELEYICDIHLGKRDYKGLIGCCRALPVSVGRRSCDIVSRLVEGTLAECQMYFVHKYTP